MLIKMWSVSSVKKY